LSKGVPDELSPTRVYALGCPPLPLGAPEAPFTD
jgi:hypothetical protein